MTTESRALLQDYIIDVEAAKPKVSGYDVVLQNNSDFIIRRKTAKLEQDVVVLVSKDLYYLKNVKTGAVESLSESNLRTFLRNLQDGMIPLDQVLWMPICSRNPRTGSTAWSLTPKSPRCAGTMSWGTSVSRPGTIAIGTRTASSSSD